MTSDREEAALLPYNSLLLSSYVGLVGIWGLSQVVLVPTPVSVIVTSVLIIFIGSHLSLRLRDKSDPQNADVEVLSSKDALKFPLIGSTVLFGFYVAYKFVDKDIINMLISIYFSIIGSFTLGATFDPAIHTFMRSDKTIGKKFKDLSWVGDLDLTFTPSLIVSILLGAALSAVYFTTKYWALNNVLAISFCIAGLEKLSVGSYKNAAILLSGLFFYDVFWVFGTDVMVTVAKSFDGPIKLLFPRQFANPLADPPTKDEFSMLGLGDIIIPGIVVAILLRYDAHRAQANIFLAEKDSFPKPFFWSNLIAYTVGLSTTLWAMYSYQAAQPALLYLVPASLITSMGMALLRGEISHLFMYTEEDVHDEESDKNK
eukprot:321192_1